jgi:hypothetical protein
MLSYFYNVMNYFPDVLCRRYQSLIASYLPPSNNPLPDKSVVYGIQGGRKWRNWYFISSPRLYYVERVSLMLVYISFLSQIFCLLKEVRSVACFRW